MYSEVMKGLQTRLEDLINAREVQIGYYGDMLQLDLRVAGILMEPMAQASAEKDTRWRSGEFQVRLWVVVGMDRSYMASMEELEDILGADGDDRTGIHAALAKIKADDTFREISGSMGGKQWRIRPPVLQSSDTRFSIQMRGSSRVNVAQVELTIFLDVER